MLPLCISLCLGCVSAPRWRLKKLSAVWGKLMPKLIGLKDLLFAYWNRGAFSWWSTILDIHLLCKLAFNSHTHLNMFFLDTVRNPECWLHTEAEDNERGVFGPERFLLTASNINCCSKNWQQWTFFNFFFCFVSSCKQFSPHNLFTINRDWMSGN